jgi:glycosyltransferase involved in cell wall biosynthesis
MAVSQRRTPVWPAPFVSVIVPVRDDRSGVRELVDRLAAQTIPREGFEVVLGDDGSRRDTLPAIASPDGWVRVIPGPPRTSYEARNRATAASRGRVLAFCDSDCLPEPTWLELGLAAVQGADVVAGEIRFVAPSRPSPWSLLTIDMFLDQKCNVRNSRGVTANLFVRRELFDELGGFDASLPSGGDYDFVRRAVERGARLTYCQHAVVWHPTIDDRRTFLHKIWRTNRSAALRRARAGQRPEIAGVHKSIPMLDVALARRWMMKPAWRLHRDRLEESGVTPSWWAELRALAALYLLVVYVRRLARMSGGLQGRRLRWRTARRGSALLADALIRPACPGSLPPQTAGDEATPPYRELPLRPPR